MKLDNIIKEIKVQPLIKYKKAYNESHSYEEMKENTGEGGKYPDYFLIDLERKKILGSFAAYNVPSWIGKLTDNSSRYYRCSYSNMKKAPPYMPQVNLDINDKNSWDNSNEILRLYQKISSENITEIKTTPKIRRGSGAYKDMYFFEKDPTKVIKTFSPSDTEAVKGIRFEEKFNQESDLFAKVYKVNYEKGWMIQEKLDVSLFEKKYDLLKKELINITKGFINIDIVAYLYDRLREKDYDNIFEIKSNLNDKSNKIFYNKLVKFLKELIQFTDIQLDIHSGNLGYKDSQIKILDI